MDNEPSKPGSNYNPTPSVVNGDQSPNIAQSDQDYQRTAAELNNEKKKRKSKPALVILLAIVIAILGGIATLAVYTYYFEKPVDEQSSQPETTTDLSALTAARVTQSLSQRMTGVASTDNVTMPPAVKIAGKSFFTQFLAGDTSVLSESESISSIHADVERAGLEKLLKDQGLEQKKLISSSPEVQQISEFSHKDIMCTLNHTKTLNNNAADHAITVACADMSAYEKLANTQQPVMRVYKNTDSITLDANMVAVGEPRFAVSSTSGYKTAELSMTDYTDGYAPTFGGFMGLFYQTPNQIWHFFKSTQSELSCAEFNTSDLKKAYLNTPCMGPNNQELKVAL